MKAYRIIEENGTFVVITCDTHTPWSRIGVFADRKDAISFAKKQSEKYALTNNIIWSSSL